MEIVRQRKKRLLAWILTLVLCVGMWQGNVMAEGEDGGDGVITPTEAGPTEGGDESAEPVAASETGDGVMPVADGDLTVTIIDSKGNNIGSEFISFGFKKQVEPSETGEFRLTGVDSLVGPDYTMVAKDIPYEHIFLRWYDENNELIELGTSTQEIDNVKAMFGNSIYVDWGGYASGMAYGQNDIEDREETVTTPNAPTSQGEGEEYMFFAGWMAEGIEGGPFANGETIQIPYDQFEMDISFWAEYRDWIEDEGTYPLITGKSFSLVGGSWKVSGDDYTYIGGNSFVVPSAGDYTFTVVEQ